MSLSHKLGEYIAAAFSGIWVQRFEHADAISELVQLCREQKWSLATWDIDQGLRIGDQAPENSPGSSDPVAAIKAINALTQDDAKHSALLVLPNFHRFLPSPEVVQALCHQIHRGKQNRTFVIILAPVVQIPVELEKDFVVIEHELPDRQQLEQIAQQVATEAGELPQGNDLDLVLEAAAGLTRMEAEGAYSLSLVRQGKVTPGAIWEIKSGMLKKSGLLQLYRGQERFTDLGGMTALKAFCTQALSPRNRHGGAKPKGILLLGVAGSGKSAFAKALGNETGRPTLMMDVGALMGSLVGQTEANLRQALRIIDAMQPAVLFIDEVEKALSYGQILWMTS
ncbi:MAG: AAA family ATPase [Phycisphaeraceae bacterium]